MTAGKHGTITHKAGKVLAINSDPEVIDILGVNLAHANLDFVSAKSGAEAITKTHAENPDIIVLDPALPDVDGNEIYRQLKDSPQSSHIPIVIISGKKIRNKLAVNFEEGVTYYITKPFDPKEVVTLVRSHLKQKHRAENVHPLTGLPNKVQVDMEIAELIDQKKKFAVVHIAMADLRAFNKVYGYDQGDRTIQLLGKIVAEAVRLFGNDDDLVGHLGGEKFAVISTPYKARVLCRRIIADFNRSIRAMYADEHLKRGYIAYENPAGIEEQSPIMSLHIAVVTNQKRTFSHHLEVHEAAVEQLDYLKRFPGSRSFLDLQNGRAESEITMDRLDTPNVYREELRVLQGLFSWLDFALSEFNTPLADIREHLEALEGMPVENPDAEYTSRLAAIRGNADQLALVMAGFDWLTRADWLTADSVFDEVDIGSALDWVVKHLQGAVTTHSIKIDITGTGEVGRIWMDRRSLTQCLLYIIRNEIRLVPPGGRLRINVAEPNDDFITIIIISPDRYITEPELKALLNTKPVNACNDKTKHELYQARLLLSNLGGKLNITSKKEKGTFYTISIPQKWPSWTQSVNSLRLATEISRKEAQAELRNVKNLSSSLIKPVPLAMKDSLEKLRGKIQELGVLCNRSLFLNEDLHSRLEIQQDYLLQQDVEQLAIVEAILIIGREVARSADLEMFNPDSTKRVVKYAMTTAEEFKLSEADRRALRHAAMLKDLGLVLSPDDMVERTVFATVEEAAAIRSRFYPVWKALSTIPFLTAAMGLVRYSYERYDGKGNNLGAKGTDIPLGARILSVASHFESLTSGMSPHSKLTPKQAVQKITDESGLRFGPAIVDTFSRVWRQ
jgi:diguanylate cyclase (GGDEF)-like protein